MLPVFLPFRRSRVRFSERVLTGVSKCYKVSYVSDMNTDRTSVPFLLYHLCFFFFLECFLGQWLPLSLFCALTADCMNNIHHINPQQLILSCPPCSLPLFSKIDIGEDFSQPCHLSFLFSLPVLCLRLSPFYLLVSSFFLNTLFLLPTFAPSHGFVCPYLKTVWVTFFCFWCELKIIIN